jgi:3-deoxy-D-manno-octulosonic acid (KDO) 8-phosphate synthase
MSLAPVPHPFSFHNIQAGHGLPFFILGPCALETEAFAWEMARALKEITTGELYVKDDEITVSPR